MRFFFKSLSGQIALAVAVALLAAQSVNFFLLLQARERLRSAELESTVERVVDLADRDSVIDRLGNDRRGRQRWNRSNRLMSLTDQKPAEVDWQQDPLSVRVNDLFLSALADADIDSDGAQARMVSAGKFFQRQFRGNTEERQEGRRGVEFVMPVDEGRWLTVTLLLPPEQPIRLQMMLVQTVVTYLVLMVFVLVVVRRLSEPLAQLTAASRTILTQEDEGLSLPSEGPEDVRQLIDAFSEMSQRVHAQFEEKTIMLGALGHDLRTPLTALRLRVEGVEDEVIREQMIESITDLSSRLEDILELARRQHDDPGQVRELCFVPSFLEEVVSGFADRTPAPVLDDVPDVAVSCMPVMVSRALTNLIENALRYGGSATIGAGINGGKLEIRIADDGPGLPEDQLTRITEPFVRGDPSRNRGTGGAGLGLALAHNAARVHGGQLELENRTEGGLVATFSLPMKDGGEG